MLAITITATVMLTLLFATLWHNEPARKHEVEKRANREQFRYE